MLLTAILASSCICTVILATFINVTLIILLITKRKKLLSTDFLLFSLFHCFSFSNVFIRNMICAVGFCLPLYHYHVGNKKYSLCQGNGYIVFKSSRPGVFCEKSVLRNFAKFTGKHLCQSLFFNKVAGTLAQVFSCEFYEIFGCFFVFASVSNNIAASQMLSIHQYVIVTRLFFGKTLKNRPDYAIICIIISWVFGLIVACIQCNMYTRFLFLICYVIPVVLILYCNSKGIMATAYQPADQGAYLVKKHLLKKHLECA